MMAPWDWPPELKNLPPKKRQAAWQAAYGAVVLRPVHFLAIAQLVFLATAFRSIGGTISNSWVGEAIGYSLGGLLGGALYLKIMRWALRPHILRFLAKAEADERVGESA
jgi:hypothetical protein